MSSAPKTQRVSNAPTSKALDEKQFNRLAGKLAQLDLEQIGKLFAETMRQKIAAVAASEIAIEEIFSVKEAADYVGVSDETIRRWCHEYDIGRQIGTTWAVSGLRLRVFIQSRDGVVVLTTPDMPDAPRYRRTGNA
jgi:hypothetical protein